MRLINLIASLVLILNISKCASEEAAVGYPFSTYALKRLVMQEQRMLPLLTEYLAEAKDQITNIQR